VAEYNGHGHAEGRQGRTLSDIGQSVEKWLFGCKQKTSGVFAPSLAGSFSCRRCWQSTARSTF